MPTSAHWAVTDSPKISENTLLSAGRSRAPLLQTAFGLIKQVSAAVIAAETRREPEALRGALLIHRDKCCVGRIRSLPTRCASGHSLQAAFSRQAVPVSDRVRAAQPGSLRRQPCCIPDPYQLHLCTVFVQMVLILCYFSDIIAL